MSSLDVSAVHVTPEELAIVTQGLAMMVNHAGDESSRARANKLLEQLGDRVKRTPNGAERFSVEMERRKQEMMGRIVVNTGDAR